MRKGQGSLEYLLILAAILAIAVVVVVVANSMLAPGQEAGAIQQDKYGCGVNGIELLNYNRQPTTLQEAQGIYVTYQGIGGATGTGHTDDAVGPDNTLTADAQCQIGMQSEFGVYVYRHSIYEINLTIQCAPGLVVDDGGRCVGA